MRILTAACIPIFLLAGLCAWAIEQGLPHTLGVAPIVFWVVGVVGLLVSAHTEHENSDPIGAALDALVQTAPCCIVAAIVLPQLQNTDEQTFLILGFCLAMGGHAWGMGFLNNTLGKQVFAWLRPAHPGFEDNKVAILVAETFAAAGVEPVLVNIHANPSNGNVSVGCSGWTTEAQRAVMDGVAQRLARMRRTHSFPHAWGGGHHVHKVDLTAHQRLQLHKAHHA